MSANDANLRAFMGDLAKFAQKTEKKFAILIQRITLDIFTRLTLRTPVDTGRARASWDIGVSQASDYVPPEGSYSAPKMDAVGKVPDIDGKKVVFITSSLHYMQYLEEGSSQQAPAGMVVVTMAEVEVELENLMAQLAA